MPLPDRQKRRDSAPGGMPNIRPSHEPTIHESTAGQISMSPNDHRFVTFMKGATKLRLNIRLLMVSNILVGIGAVTAFVAANQAAAIIMCLFLGIGTLFYVISLVGLSDHAKGLCIAALGTFVLVVAAGYLETNSRVANALAPRIMGIVHGIVVLWLVRGLAKRANSRTTSETLLAVILFQNIFLIGATE